MHRASYCATKIRKYGKEISIEHYRPEQRRKLNTHASGTACLKSMEMNMMRGITNRAKFLSLERQNLDHILYCGGQQNQKNSRSVKSGQVRQERSTMHERVSASLRRVTDVLKTLQ